MPSSASTDDLLAERYGRPAPGRRNRMVLLGAALAVLGVGWVAWAGWEHSHQEVTGQLQGYTVIDDTTTEVTVVVDRRTGAAVECDIYAQADDHSRVGERVLHVPAGEPGTVVVTETITTQRRAVTGVLAGCAAAD